MCRAGRPAAFADDLRVLLLDRPIALEQIAAPARLDRRWRLLVRRVADRHGLLDRQPQRQQIVWQVIGGEVGASGDHAAADIDADGGRDDRALGRDHRADRRTLAVMHIRHYRDVFEDERQTGDIVELPLRAVLDWHAARPHLQWRATGLAVNVIRFCHRFPSQGWSRVPESNRASQI